jgi:hypothetical protein
MSILPGLFAVVPASLLLAVSFFILLALRKNEEKGIKTFGYVVVALLWLSAALVFTVGIYSLATGKGCMMQKMMHYKSEKMMYPGHPGYMKPGFGKTLPGCGKPMHYKKSITVENVTQ